MSLSQEQILEIDKNHIWHPYSSINSTQELYAVESCSGVSIRLKDGRELIDGMASWWSMIHGYNHPELNQAIHRQLESTAHVMFGGLTHEPAAQLAQTLVEISPRDLEQVFFCDSGSVAVEVALKMAVQYWHAKGLPQKHKILSLRSGYHGDTFGAMSVCDPETGMHQLFNGVLAEQLFSEAPGCKFDQPWDDRYIQDIQQQLEQHHQQLAAVILEPIVQGAGGMRFYSPEYLRRVKQLCAHFDVLLIADEIATGFGRAGKLFACEFADISPDILCLGKALTGGYLTLAATLCTNAVAETICAGEAGCFMHGPTFMANPLACAVANKSIELLLKSPWQEKIRDIEKGLRGGLAPCSELQSVADVRCLGAIGVVEMKEPVDMARITPAFVQQGVWVRPFGTRVYVMPPYCITTEQLTTLTDAIFQVLSHH
ncbi:adenosylmethionine--8-amino-7-oxononanoate transaminase [Teredinibacter haidensis]|uniref:adenosylmethionine--8-amino-7-oxononanoate transaminase n=1 Tax=Teredinibacter haidensis TaxID=2731755 RepID=UPI000948F7A1|nr:adenosylmethionine--8-amino-7-oxononanoate transaminase [Teredinibacter haidensis]